MPKDDGDAGRPTGVQLTVTAPGKVILHGEHSVVYGKLAVAASLGLRTKLILTELSSADTNYVTFNLPALNFSKVYDLQIIQKLMQSYGDKSNFYHPETVDQEAILAHVVNFIKSTCDPGLLNSSQFLSLKSLLFLFAAILGSADVVTTPFDLTVTTDLNIGAGTGSSASFNVCLAASFLKYVNLKTNVTVGEHLDCFSISELDLISKWAFCAEKIIHGTPSGIDNTVCTFGNMVEFRKGTSPKLVQLKSKFKILLVNTKVPRETKQLVAKVAELFKEQPAHVETILNDLEDVANAAVQRLRQMDEGVNDDNLKTIQKYYEDLGHLAVKNHKLLNCLGVSHKKLNEVVAVLAENGFSGKLTGAGGGGYAISLVPPYTEQSLVDRVVNILESCGFHVVIADLGGGGVDCCYSLK